ncbi:hypothetical protein OG828_49190 [Streptomyces sp. NBC_00457]|uniref:hypothetical protein n=1 Tax=Streptomyces sp. NBC_00457 TaxID=2975748 RepID=UPI002E1DEC48
MISSAPANAADDYNQAVPGSPPSGMSCYSNSYLDACFKKYGDQLWVRNHSASSPAYMQWENWLYMTNGGWELYRQGNCTTTQLNVGQWGVCNKDFYENTTERWDGTGSMLRWRIISGASISSWGPYYLNDQ